jgi:mono/diheme cytochrome c family protein
MAKKLLFIVTVLTVTASFVAASFAFEPGDERKGKYMFRKNCRACHIDGGTAKALSPNSKTQAQWEKAFEKYDRYQCVAEWNKLTPEDRTNILTYLHGHAIDSPAPATCAN